jgi:antitoxin MazE
VETQIGKWGNSLAIRIPRAFVREARLDEGMAVELSVEEGRLIVTPRRRYSLDQLVAGITDENRHAETDWGEPVGNEAW